jgi:hypothetical protein
MPEKLNEMAGTSENEAVFFEATSKTIKAILDLVTSTITVFEAVHGLSIDDIFTVLRVGERYDFHTLPGMLLPIMHLYAVSNPWKVFTFAVKHDFHLLAKCAIEELARDGE